MRSFVAVLSAVLLATACSSCGIADGAFNSTVGQATSVAGSTTASGPDVPETLSAATAAAQANVDPVWSQVRTVVGTAFAWSGNREHVLLG